MYFIHLKYFTDYLSFTYNQTTFNLRIDNETYEKQ